jgi:HAE1 family hydrophobic/amphiphilic exporter-1
MDEVQGAIIGTSLVLIAVFIPSAFVPGITGQFHVQFAVTISVATIISTINSLSLSPALAGILLKPRATTPSRNPLTRLAGVLSGGFDRAFDSLSNVYGRVVSFLVGTWGMLILVLALFCGLLFATWQVLQSTPTGFIPESDQGYAIVVVQLPDGASLDRTDAVIRQAEKIARETPGVSDAVAFAGFSGATFTSASNQGVIFTPFDSFEDRLEADLPAHKIVGALFGRMQVLQEAFIIAIAPHRFAALAMAAASS